MFNGVRSGILAVDDKATALKMKSISQWSPTGEVEALVVDDHAAEWAATLNAEPRYGGALHFDAVELKAGADLVRKACRAFKAIHAARKRYGFVLLGLRFGEMEGMDLSGYQLLPVLRRFFPHLPVVVCSFHDDMGKLARAFRNGAKWFLRKHELPNLPQILVSLLTRRDWEAEWRTVQLCDLVDFEFEQSRGTEQFKSSLDEARQYLTYKCLEKFPGRTIRGRPMSGGFSTSVTFKAVKMTGDGKMSLQMPLVVKIDTLANTQMEHERYFRFIRPYIPNDAGRVEEPERVIDRDHAAIVYTFAGTDGDVGRLKDMKSIVDEHLSGHRSGGYASIRPVLDDLFDVILPRIHHVSPDSEMGEMSELTSFPNPEFGEVDPKNFLANWISRISVRRKIDNVGFERQSDTSRGKELIGFEYFTSYDCGDHCAIEAYDEEKMTVVLTGSSVDEVVRNKVRGLRAGAMLWLDNNKCRYYTKKARGGRACREPVGCDETLSPLMEKPVAGYETLPSVLASVQRLVSDDRDGTRFSCPVGIVHGDLNFANVMIETRPNPVRGKAKTDVWLVDFARTRRDLIVHDFSIMFAATVGLVDEDLSGVAVAAVFAVSDGIPAMARRDERKSLVYRILRRIRRAALASGVSRDMFALSCALSLMMTFRMAFRYNRFYLSAEGMLKASNMIVAKLGGAR